MLSVTFPQYCPGRAYIILDDDAPLMDSHKTILLLRLFLILLCGRDRSDASAAQLPSSSPSREGVGPRPNRSEVAPRTDRRPVSGERPSIVAFGNSLTAGLGVPPDQSYPGAPATDVGRSGLCLSSRECGGQWRDDGRRSPKESPGF